MQRFFLDTTKVSTTDELHEALKRQLGLPSYYGKNLDALWDCLTGWIDLPLTVEWRGFTEARQAIGEDVDKLLETFRQAEGELDGFKVEIIGT
jgi:ribonuclease inhibitor